MQQVQVMRRFAAPIERVFDRYTDWVSWTQWAGMGRVTLAQEGRPSPNGVGCVRRIANPGVAMDEEIVTFERPGRIAYRIVRGPMPMRDHLGEVTFEPDGTGTRVTWGCRFNATIPFLGAPLRWLIARVFRKALEGLAADLGEKR